MHVLAAEIYEVYRIKTEAGRGIEQPLPQLIAYTYNNEFAPDLITVITPSTWNKLHATLLNQITFTGLSKELAY